MSKLRSMAIPFFSILAMLLAFSLSVTAQAESEDEIYSDLFDDEEVEKKPSVESPKKEILIKKSPTHTIKIRKVSDGKKKKSKRKKKVRRVSRKKLRPTHSVQRIELPSPKVEKEKESPWILAYTFWADTNVKETHDLEATVNGLSLVTVGYKLDNDVNLIVQPTFIMKYNLGEGNTKHDIGNIDLRATKNKLASFLGLDLNGRVDFYLPTGQAFRDAETKGAFRADLKLVKEFSPEWTAYYLFIPRYYLQGNRSSAQFDEFGRLSTTAKSNTGVRAYNAVGGSFAPNKIISFYQELGVDYHFKYDDPNLGNDGANTSSFDTWTSVALNLFDGVLGLELGLARSHPLQDEDGFSLIDTEEMAYHLIGTVNF